MKKLFKILFIVFIVFLGLMTFIKSPDIQTNLLNAIFSENENAQTTVDLSNKFSSKINVTIETDLPELAEKTASQFLKEINPDIFKVGDVDFKKILNDYQRHSEYLLSKGTRELLKNKDYETVKREAFERLLNPIGMSILPINEDPFFFFSDFLNSISKDTANTGIINYKDKYYKIIPLSVNKEISLSPSLANKEIKKLIKLQRKYSNGGTAVYLTGAPVHSYHASEKSMIEINIICILSVAFLLGLFYFAFRNIKLFFPAVLSLLIGIFSGICATGIIFGSEHILTFVFSTTLIGICIDYSLHYFTEKSFDKLKKSMTISLLSTTFAFLIMLFSGVELLKQISVFTITGLTSVYMFVLLFYPDMCQKLFSDYERTFSVKFNKPVRVLILFFIFMVMCLGIFRIKFNSEIKNMYVPSKEMIKAEKLFAEITKSEGKTIFAIVKGENIEDILQKEELTTKNANNYQSISKYIPSHKQQSENRELIRDLYKNSLYEYANTFLTPNQISEIENKKPYDTFIEPDLNSPFAEFLLNETTSVIVFSGENEITPSDDVEIIDLPQKISQKISTHGAVCVKLLLPAIFGLFLLLSAVYGNYLKAFKVLLPSVIALCFSLCFTALITNEINLFHILSLYLIVGFGLDYSVFRVSAVKNSSLAIFLSCATSVFSFALLAFTGFKLISSMGIILSTGLLSSYILSLILIPEQGFEDNKEHM